MIAPRNNPAPLAPLRVHSGGSMVRGTATVEALVARAAELGCRQLALTDVNSLCSAPAFWKAALREGIEPILGAELHHRGRKLLALVTSDAGYTNLCRAVTATARDDAPGLLADPARRKGLEVVLLDAPDPAGLAGRDLSGVHVAYDPVAMGRPAATRAARTAERLGLPLVGTASALLGEPRDADLAGVLAAIRLGCTVTDVPADQLPPPGAHLRGPEQLAAELAGTADAAEGNRRLAERCAGFSLLPRQPVFPRFDASDAGGPAARLRQLCREGLARRYGARPPAGAEPRLQRELDLIQRMGFVEYFLVVWDIVQYARGREAPVAGRGSGASSLVAYLLGITNVCPLTYEIPFERFLHPQREDFPDLDVDFCWRIRDEVIDYAFDRWGRQQAAMVCTHNTFQPRSALREAARAFGYSDRQISDGTALAEGPHRRQLTDLARRMVGLVHHLSVHPGGVVIGREPIDHYAPIETAAKGVPIAQYDKHGVKDIGLVKLDLLGNRNLSTVRYACGLIRDRHGRSIDIESLPPDDPPTVARLRAGDTIGCNQLESPAMRHLLKMMRPSGTADVMKALALIRPGAASIGMKEAFIRRLRGQEPVPTGHGPTDAVLAGTGGVMLYEDDVMLAAAAMLGCDLPTADRFRKAVQKCHDDAERLELSQRFLAGCRANGVEGDYAKAMWVQMAKFNAYSFCRAHAGSYALLAWAGAWLKTHYPLEFWTAALNNNQSMYPPRMYLQCARRDGVGATLPNVNRSGEQFTIDHDEDTLRVGLGFVDDLGPAGAARILDARADGPFASLTDFLQRTALGRNETRNLVLCGGFDFTGRTRPTLMMELNLYFSAGPGRGGRHPGDARRGGTLFGRSTWAAPAVPALTDDYTWHRKFADEFRILGLAVRQHPLAPWRDALAGRVDADSRHLPGRIGRAVTLAGMIEARRTVRTDRGETMMFLTFDDEFGPFEVTVFPDALRRQNIPLDRYGPYIIQGTAEQQFDSVTVTAQHLRRAPDRATPAPSNKTLANPDPGAQSPCNPCVGPRPT